MIKNISFKDLFFKQDHTGKRQPTVLAWVIIVAAVFGSFFLSKGKEKPRKKEVKQDIIKETDIIAASNSFPKKSDNLIDLSPALDMAKAGQGGHRFSDLTGRGKIDSKMIVFDGTSNYQSDQIVPLGSMVKCILIHNIVTNNFSSPVVVQLWEDFYFDGKLLLPFGTRIYGTARAGKERDRVLVAFHTAVFQDGREVKLSAIGLSEDGSGGLTGQLVKKENKKHILLMAMNFLSGIALGLQHTATNAVTGISEVATNSRNATLEGVANTFESEARRLEKEIDAAEGYAIVFAGNQLIVYFEKATDVKPL